MIYKKYCSTLLVGMQTGAAAVEHSVENIKDRTVM